ncbi:PREDICTED: T-lymphocyte activation antigen CD80-like [Calidris pugnax]|uniref:T-lymphocyte activation antigen CD80-like n=1 Tax=Calidris pugnax TaxID=198806 RepID=UPI00071DEB1D|nr:PREDICTED: T-lymphocyte activation antigen CD80-like [Calidris pugnax]
MACLPTAPPALALRRWLGLGLFVGLCLHLGCALEKKEVKSKLGETVGLPCCHEIPSSDSLHNYRVYWQKNIREVVLAYAEGKEISKNQRYENRTEMNDRNFTLWISPVEIPDKGPYQCIVQHLKSSQNPSVLCDETVTLVVAADFSEPNITAEVTASSCESMEMVVTCFSYGGFPKPKMSGTLNNESVVWNVSWVSESSLSPYNVTGKLQLNVTKDVIFTCSVESDGLTKSASLLLKKTNDCIVPTVPPSYNVITASSIIIIIFLLAITLAARYLPRHVCSRCHKPQDSVEEGVKECTKTPLSSKVTSETSSV